jgi:hypothetical protein
VSVTLQGLITGDGGPLVGATVSAYDMTGAYIADTSSIGDGTYSFSLAPGIYKLYADGTGEGANALWYGGGGSFSAGSEIFLVSDPVTANVALSSSVARFSLNGITVRVWDYSGFDYPSFASIVGLLASSLTGRPYAIQTGSLPPRQAKIGCTLRAWSDVLQLRAWNQSKEQLTWIDALGETLNVVLFDLSVTTLPGGIAPEFGLGIWTYTMTLVEIDTSD